MERVSEIKKELWGLLQVNDIDSGVRVQRLQEEANSLVLSKCGVSYEDLGDCAICNNKLNYTTVSRDEVGVLRLDSNEKLWCTECATAHDSIDWDS